MKIMRSIQASTTLLALLAVGAAAFGQTSLKPLSKQAPAKNPKFQQAKAKPGVNNRPFFGSGGSWALGVNGSDNCSNAPAIAGSGDFTFDTTSATTGAEGQSQTTHLNNDIWWEWTADASGSATAQRLFDKLLIRVELCLVSETRALDLSLHTDHGGIGLLNSFFQMVRRLVYSCQDKYSSKTLYSSIPDAHSTPTRRPDSQRE